MVDKKEWKQFKLTRRRIDIDHPRYLYMLNQYLESLNNCVNYPQKIMSTCYDIEGGKIKNTTFERYGEQDVDRRLRIVNELIQKIAFQIENHCVIVKFVPYREKFRKYFDFPYDLFHHTPDYEEMLMDQLSLLRFRSKYHQEIYLKKYNNFEDLRWVLRPEVINKSIRRK